MAGRLTKHPSPMWTFDHVTCSPLSTRGEHDPGADKQQLSTGKGARGGPT